MRDPWPHDETEVSMNPAEVTSSEASLDLDWYFFQEFFSGGSCSLRSFAARLTQPSRRTGEPIVTMNNRRGPYSKYRGFKLVAHRPLEMNCFECKTDVEKRKTQLGNLERLTFLHT